MIGLANWGTQLLTKITGLGSDAASLSVPNQICGFSCQFQPELLYLVLNGQHITAAGSTSLPIANGTVDVLYEVTTPPVFGPYAIPVTLLDASGSPLDFPAATVFAGTSRRSARLEPPAQPSRNHASRALQSGRRRPWCAWAPLP